MLRSTGKPSICFVAPNNYARLSGREDIQHIGGAEVQRVWIARELVRRGYRVSFVTLDHGQPDGIEHDGIQVFKSCDLNDGLPGVRFFHPRWTKLCAAMTRADADVYYHRTAGIETGQVALWCKAKRRAFMLGIASDPECDRRLGAKKSRRDRWFYYYGLKSAHMVVAQTHTQQQMLATNFGIQSPVIRSCSMDPGGDVLEADALTRFQGRRVLWVGRFTALKRLDWLASLAENCPTISFDVVGDARHQNDEVRNIKNRLRSLPNVSLHGFLPFRAMDVMYNRAALLLSTSAWEGYPNVFMEAWARGVPTVSTVDPDDVITTHGLGIKAESIASLQTAIERMLESFDTWQAGSEQSRNFFLQNHTIAAAVDAFEPLIERACQMGNSSAPRVIKIPDVHTDAT